MRERAHDLYAYLVAADSTDMNIRMLMAMNLERMERFDESFKVFEYLLDSTRAKRVDSPEILNYYGYTLIDMNRSPEELDRGIAMVDEALATEKTKQPSEAYLDSKAWGLYRKGQFAEALEVMKLIKSPRFDEDYVYWEHMALIQEALGLKAETKAAYKKLQKLQPRHPAVKKYFKKK